MYMIYQATCIVNNKSYIGLTKRTLKQRKYQHEWNAKNNSSNHFHRALSRHGCENFSWRIIEDNISSGEEAKEREKFYVKLHETNIKGYNSTEGGDDFTSSEYQRQLQLKRVADKTHPFLGGEIQRKSSKERWKNGTNKLISMNQKLVAERKHIFQKENRHWDAYNKTAKPWFNTNCEASVWRIADQLYAWYTTHKDKKRGGGPYQMAKDFNISTSLQVIYYKYFEQGWIPQEDPEWVIFTRDLQH